MHNSREQTPIIALDHVSKRYGGTDNPVYALRDVTLGLDDGEYISIMGASGSGKSTLFNMIGGLDICSAGQVRIGGVDLGSLDDAELAYFRGRHIGYIFQTYNLIASMTALRNVMLPALLLGEAFESARSRAVEVLARVGLEHRLEHRPGQLSGGQQQRVAIARALVNVRRANCYAGMVPVCVAPFPLVRSWRLGIDRVPQAVR